MNHIVNNFNFSNLRLVHIIQYFDIKYLKKCHTLNLACTNITDESVKELKNCHTLNLSYTNITDESVKRLKNCHTLDLSGTKITNITIFYLRLHGCVVDILFW